ncbi:MAG: DNA mismatch repair endonuclease MutL [Cyclobacteriaceae bacterium]|nr:DNA mismatch repair endonuclease MutL [Cyclobacteriaceae bacterium]
MSDVIKLLPESIANQIAAGEVVQRPASVVKELIENSVDAEAGSITLLVKDAGRSLIQIVDDGKGMSETDARMSFERHATSKIQKSEDLFSIKTMGFRGEALPSISAVAQVEMKTRPVDEEIGTSIAIDGSHFKGQHNTSCKQGTTILVKNLFFNVPARRNFLKSNPVELRHIMDEFHRLALANPEKAFKFHQNDIEVYKLNPGKLSQRIVGLFGKNYRAQLVPCEEKTEEVSLKGYIGKADFVKKSRGEQFFFVNNRFIKSNYLNHAVVSAYEGLIPEGTFPFFVLFIEIDPKRIDVNVHPTKTEIKFDDERSIYSLIKISVKKTLGSFNITPSLDFGVDTNFRLHTAKISASSGLSTSEREYSQFKNIDKDSSNLKNWEQLYAGALDNETIEAEVKRELAAQGNPLSLTFESAINKMDEHIHQEGDNNKQNIFQFHLSYVVTPVKSGLMLIDQQSAHERIYYERYIKILEKNSGSSQQLLFPETLELNPSDFSLVKELEKEIKGVGFAFEYFGENAIVINGVPSLIEVDSGREIFNGVLEDYKKNFLEYKSSNIENLARSMATNSGIKRGRKLATEEMKSIVDHLFACKNPNYSPNGRLIYYIFGLEKIEDIFNIKP